MSSAHPRLVDGKPSKNPRYLQLRTDLSNPVGAMSPKSAHASIAACRSAPPLCEPVNAVLVGRRNNPPEPGIRPLAVYNPIHYQELPELFMDFVCSLTGKSPSTTGAGSEGALTKGPFNALRPTVDLNNALVSFILTRLCRVLDRGRLYRPQAARRPRHQPAGAGNLVATVAKECAIRAT